MMGILMAMMVMVPKAVSPQVLLVMVLVLQMTVPAKAAKQVVLLAESVADAGDGDCLLFFLKLTFSPLGEQEPYLC